LDKAPILARTMDDLGIDSPERFQQWINEEREYLNGLKTEPPEETWQMEYFEKLLALKMAR
jgi:hypothetical protein